MRSRMIEALRSRFSSFICLKLKKLALAATHGGGFGEVCPKIAPCTPQAKPPGIGRYGARNREITSGNVRHNGMGLVRPIPTKRIASYHRSSSKEGAVTALSIGFALIAVAVLVFWICMPRDGMVAPFLRSGNLQTAVGLFITCAMAVGILMILHGAFE